MCFKTCSENKDFCREKSLHRLCYGLNVCAPYHYSYVENLIPKMMVLGSDLWELIRS